MDAGARLARGKTSRIRYRNGISKPNAHHRTVVPVAGAGQPHGLRPQAERGRVGPGRHHQAVRRHAATGAVFRQSPHADPRRRGAAAERGHVPARQLRRGQEPLHGHALPAAERQHAGAQRTGVGRGGAADGDVGPGPALPADPVLPDGCGERGAVPARRIRGPRPAPAPGAASSGALPLR